MEILMLAVLLAAAAFLILKQQTGLKKTQELEQQLAEFQEKLDPEVTRAQTREQLEQLEVRLRQQEQATATQTQNAVVSAVGTLGQGINASVGTLTSSLGEHIRTMSGELKTGLNTMKTSVSQGQETAARQ